MRTWARIAALSFGGPAGQIAVMHRILVDEKRWIGEARFLHALNYCMLLPGPEAQQLAIYIGWLLHRTRGGLVAGTLFVLPGFLAIMALSLIYAAFGTVGIVQALFFGLKAAVLAIVLEAVMRIGRRALKNNVMVGIAAAAFVAIFFFGVPFPFIILAAGLVGLSGRPRRPAGLPAPAAGTARARAISWPTPTRRLARSCRPHARPGLAWSLKVAGICLVLWLAPVARACCSPWDRATCSARSRSSSPRWRWSPSAAPMRCWPTSPRRPSRPMAGCGPARCWTAWAWPRPRPAR